MHTPCCRPELGWRAELVYALFNPEGDVAETVETDQDQETTQGGGKALMCAVCRHVITRRGDKTSMHGKHAHVFFNPAGIVFEVGCFRAAPGCVPLGRPTLEFTWFDGYAWRICVCAQCQTHLGWHYQAVDGAGAFYGLILSQLVEGEQ